MPCAVVRDGRRCCRLHMAHATHGGSTNAVQLSVRPVLRSRLSACTRPPVNAERTRASGDRSGSCRGAGRSISVTFAHPACGAVCIW